MDGAGGARPIVGELVRLLEDLLLFEGRHIVVPPAAEAPASGPAGGSGQPASGLDAYHREICGCTRCPLGQTRRRFVFGSGHPEAGILFVGEGPGAEEDAQGLPFVGAAGQLLTRIIEAMRLSRDEVYICNAVKCRPPNNRPPRPEELAACLPHLQRQIELVSPRVIAVLGRTAAQALLGTGAPMHQLRGRVLQYQGIPAVVTYHPAALLRHPQWKREAWEDVKQVRRLYDGLEL